jgi:hypothetical protein
VTRISSDRIASIEAKKHELAQAMAGGDLAPDLRVPLTVPDDGRVRHLLLELGEARADLVDELVDHGWKRSRPLGKARRGGRIVPCPSSLDLSGC